MIKTLIAAFIIVLSFVPAFATANLGTAETFAVLGASTVTNTGVTKIRGNLGVSPGTAVVGFPPGIMLEGTIHAGDAVAMQAQNDLTMAYNAVAALPCKHDLTGRDLGGLTLTPGVYCFDSSAQLTGTLILDFQQNPRASFVFQIGSTLTTASDSRVELSGCVKGCSIDWQVGSSATLGVASKFSGNLMALASITVTTNVQICGRVLAQTGAVTMDTDVIWFMGTLTPPVDTITGGGQIDVTAAESGEGRASFTFVSDSTGKGSFLDYSNGFTGLHTYGLVANVAIMEIYPDASPKTVELSGTCHSSLPRCFFTATVLKSERPEEADQFGIAIAGSSSETTSPRALASGKIQLH